MAVNGSSRDDSRARRVGERAGRWLGVFVVAVVVIVVLIGVVWAGVLLTQALGPLGPIVAVVVGVAAIIATAVTWTTPNR